MVTFEEALEKARSIEKVVNGCIEYDKGYLFFDENYDGDGGDDGVVIVKEDGKAIGFVSFLCNYHPDPKFKKRSIGKT